jgi:NhaP-type Na+/H+ or K+/H+ antiporter
VPVSDLGIIAAVVVAYGLVSSRLDRTPITAPMVFVAAGILLGPDVLDQVGLELTTGAGLVVAEVTLVIVLFSDAARIDLAVLRENESLPARLLGIGMPLTIGLGLLAGGLLLTGIDFWEAAIIAAVLAPTDAALGQAVVSSDAVPRRIRQALNVESGLNDGLSVPFLFLFVGLAVEEMDPGAAEWIAFAAEQIGLGALAGLAVGGIGGWLVKAATERRLMTGTFQQLTVLALAVAALALADQIGGNGFIAAFVGGLATGRITPVCGDRILDFTEDEGQLLTAVVFFIFGVGAIPFLDAVTWEVLAFALLALTAVRMLPVALSVLGTGLRPSTVAFLGWFGPRGLASIILALVVVEEEPELAGLDVVLAAMTVTVLASVVAHGATARPLVRAYSRRAATIESGAPEHADVADMPTRGHLSEPV